MERIGTAFTKEEQLFSRLREEDVQIYVIGFVRELDKDAGFIRKSPRDKAVNLLNKFATETGGRVFFPESYLNCLRSPTRSFATCEHSTSLPITRRTKLAMVLIARSKLQSLRIRHVIRGSR